METYELVEELSNKPSDEIRLSLLMLMLKNKIDFIDLNEAYVKFLNMKNEDKENLIGEANGCILQMLDFVAGKKKLSDYQNAALQRSLYYLNMSQQVNTEQINVKYGYVGNDEAKNLSWYERNKARREDEEYVDHFNDGLCPFCGHDAYEDEV